MERHRVRWHKIPRWLLIIYFLLGGIGLALIVIRPMLPEAWSEPTIYVAATFSLAFGALIIPMQVVKLWYAVAGVQEERNKARRSEP